MITVSQVNIYTISNPIFKTVRVLVNFSSCKMDGGDAFASQLIADDRLF